MKQMLHAASDYGGNNYLLLMFFFCTQESLANVNSVMQCPIISIFSCFVKPSKPFFFFFFCGCHGLSS